MSSCVPQHIICDTYQPNYAPSNTTSLPVRSAAKRARSSGPQLGAVWRSVGFGQTANDTSVRVTWQHIRRFNGFSFATPPSVFSVPNSQYVEIDVKIEVLVGGNLTETYYTDNQGNPLYTQTAEWTAIDTTDDMNPDTVVLCWTCTNNTVDTSNIISIISSDINDESVLITIPEVDKQTILTIPDGQGGSTEQNWNLSTHAANYIGGDITLDATALDSAASNNNPYSWPDIQLSGATLTSVPDKTGSFFSLVLAVDSEVGNDDGQLEQDANDLLYFGQQTLPNCYSVAWLPYLPSSDLDCGMPISGFNPNQNAFIINDTVSSEISPGDTFVVYGALIEDASNKSQAEFGNYRMIFTVDGVNQPGNGTTTVIVDEDLPTLHARYRAVGGVCPSDSCL